jgi:7-cyano-7-deazaguanine reductase
MAKKHTYTSKIEQMSRARVKKQQQGVKRMRLPSIETLDFLYADGGEVTYETEELTALCPMTGLPDHYQLAIIYTPGKLVPELKSLKLYLVAFRDVPILHEHLACRVFDDFNRAVVPKRLRVELIASVRGGITSTVVKELD